MKNLPDNQPDYVRRIEERVTASESYYGETRHIGALVSDPVWRIEHIHAGGGITNKEFALGGGYKCRWSDRHSYFEHVSYANNYSLEFDGVNDYVSFGDTFLYDISNAWSFSCWVKPDNLATRRTIYSKTNTDPAQIYGWGFYIEADGSPFIQVRTASTTRAYTGSPVFTAGTWQHFMFTYAGGANMNGISVYRDGVINATPPASGTLSNTLLLNQTAMVGSRNGAFPFSGFIDEVSIWNRVLTQSEVTEVYNGGSPVNPTLLVTAPNLAHHYSMGDNDEYPTITDQVGVSDGTMINMTPDDIVLEAPQ